MQEKQEDNKELWITVSSGDINEFWKPKEEGERLIGKLESVAEIKEEEIYLLRTRDNRLVAAPQHRALTRILKKLHVGDVLRITYTGQRTSKDGMQYYTYVVEVRADEEESI